MTASECISTDLATTKNPKDPTFYRHEDTKERAYDRIDYRNRGGPLLSYIWCQQGNEESPLQGQNLFLGAEIGSDGKMYCIPGHADRVMQVNPATDEALLIGPNLPGKYKWLRGVPKGDFIYGLPCHADTVLKIHVATGDITTLPILYESFFPGDADAAVHERHLEWKYHGGNVSPIDGCIYSIPQSANYVLKVDPTTDIATLIGPALPGKYKWYGGVVGKQDGAVYGIPHNSPHVLRIHPEHGVTLHGDFGKEGHQWHGAAAAPNGVIVCVAANADTVLCITPSSPAPLLTELGDATVLRSGRHRSDGKYKFLGATAGPDGRVYCFPCAAERVLAVDTVRMTVHSVGPNIYDDNMERLCQNKWQNGVYVREHDCIFGIPLAAESLLQIDFRQLDAHGDPVVRTWPIPAPHRCLGKWEGALVAPNGITYSIPNNHKALLRIELPIVAPKQALISTTSAAFDEEDLLKRRSQLDRPDYSHREDLVYKSGIPTLRASAHRVKFSPKNRKHDPNPKNSRGEATGTPWLPNAVCDEEVFLYDLDQFGVRGSIIALLKRCDPAIVGRFCSSGQLDRLEDFLVPTESTWREVNGGQCESAQRYLSDAVAGDNSFLTLFDRLVTEVVLLYLKSRLVAVGSLDGDEPTTFYYQRPPTLRLQPGPAWAQVKPHNDSEYGHQNGELNFWLPLTDRDLTGVDLWCETSFNADDYHPIPARVGEIASFHGSSRRHYVNSNSTANTRASFDFRVGVQGFFDPTWEMQGTNDDHTRREFTL